jgi:hypothetical protein
MRAIGLDARSKCRQPCSPVSRIGLLFRRCCELESGKPTGLAKKSTGDRAWNICGLLKMSWRGSGIINNMGAKRTVKRCPQCREPKPLAEFYKSPRAAGGVDGYCKLCRQTRDLKRSQSWVARKKADDPEFFRRHKLLKNYGITPEDYAEKCASQDNLCAMCGRPERRVLYGAVANLSIDHDHSTGELRALLCCRCNAALGTIENPDLLLLGLRYLSLFCVPDERYLRVAREIQEGIAANHHDQL